MLCRSIPAEFPRCMVFTGRLVFHHETFVDRILRNQTAIAIQRRLRWEGILTMIMPIRAKI